MNIIKQMLAIGVILAGSARAGDLNRGPRPDVIASQPATACALEGISPNEFKQWPAQLNGMIQRFEARGLDVAAAKTALAAWDERVKGLDLGQVWPEEIRVALCELRLAKRELFLRDPDLAPLEHILFVKRQPYKPSHNYTDITDGNLRGWPAGGVYRLDIPRVAGRLCPEQAVETELFKAADTGIARDVTLDWDAQTIWFAYMPDTRNFPGELEGYRDTGTDRSATGKPDTPETRRWHIYRMPITGGQPQQVTSGAFHDYYPCVLPDGDIAFISSRCNKRFICFRPTSMTLFRMKPNGSHIRVVSHNNLSEWFPTVRRDGRIMWTRSEYLDKGADYGHTIWAIHPDGSNEVLVYGNNVGNFGNAIEVPGRDNELCALEISHFGDFNGPVVYIDLAKGPYDPKALTVITKDKTELVKGNGGVYRDPVPIAPDLVLVSHKEGEGVEFGLYVIDRHGNKERLHLPRGDNHCMTPIPLQPRPRPPVLPEVSGQGPATMLVMDVYDGLGDKVERGSVKWLRICREEAAWLEQYDDGILKERYYDGHNWGFTSYYASPVVEAGKAARGLWPTYAAKGVDGLVPVDADGSAHFEVPTGVMFYFQALDKDLNEIQRMRSVVQAVPGETRSCIGCHEDRRKTPALNRRVSAMTRPPDKPLPPPWGAGPFWFDKAVQPVLDRNCVSCHGATAGKNQRPDLTSTIDAKSKAPVSYFSLLRYVHIFNHGWKLRHTLAEPLTFGTVKSELFAILQDKNHAEVKLTADELHALKCWVDLNAPMWGDYQHRGERLKGKPYRTINAEATSDAAALSAENGKCQ